MPKLREQLREHSIVFGNAFVPTPVCCPSRASILTGQYAHNTEVLTNRPPKGGAQAFREESTLATWLHDTGYRTALVGKYLNGYVFMAPHIPPGWDVWYAFSAPGYYTYSLNDNGTLRYYAEDLSPPYSTDLLADKAVEFIKKAGSQPFFLYFAPFAPHAPFTPAQRHQTLPVPPPRRGRNYNERDLSDKPARLRKKNPLTSAQAKEIDEVRANQIRSLRAVDTAIDRVFSALAEAGITNRTFVLFTSDNGYLWGEHRLQGKGVPYEESIRVPFALRYPKLIEFAREEERLVLNMDIAPTLAELAGVAPPLAQNGRSLVPVLTNSATDWRDDFLLEYWDPTGAAVYVGIRTRRWKYVEYASEEEELYDLSKDKYELENLAGDPAYERIQTRLAERLRELQQE